MKLSADAARKVAALLRERRTLLRAIASQGRNVRCHVEIGREYRLPVPRAMVRNVIQARIAQVEQELAAHGVEGGQE